VGTLGLVARSDEVLRVADVRRHPAFEGLPPGHPDIGSLLGVPIRFKGRSIGNLYLANKRGAPEFTEHDQHLVETLAARVGVALETAQLYRDEGAARAWLSGVLEQMAEGVVLVDARGRVAAHSKSSLALSWGDTGERDPLGNPVMLDLRRPSGERLPPAELPYVRALLRGETVTGLELLLVTRPGDVIPVCVSAAPVRGRAEEVTGATMLLLDITHLKELERLREEWASIVAHDMRQPVSVIALSAATLAKHHDGPLPEANAKLIERITGAAAMLSRSLDDLLDASSIEAGRLSIQPREVALPGLIGEIVARTPHLAERCEVHVDPAVKGTVRADPDRVGQVLGNLLSNAMKYGAPDVPIRVAVADRDGEEQVTVTNAGRGIPPDELPLLFSRFGRCRDARQGGLPGLGLGLYICKGIVEAHGGRIWAESTPEERTSFSFTLPLAA
jgi:signal transduction histidine kinase